MTAIPELLQPCAPGDGGQEEGRALDATALRGWLAAQGGAGLDWLAAVLAGVAAGGADRALFAAFAAAPRQVGREELPALALRPALTLSGWTRDQAARTLLLLARPTDAGFLPALDRLFRAADLGELVCLYQALPLLPFPERHRARAAEGLRSNMLPVFRAVSLGNPYPAAWLDEGAWNQMVVKAVFTGCSLHGIVGLDARANPALAAMLVNYARERRAAGRFVPPGLWRPVGPFAGQARALDEMRRALDGGGQGGQAVALALIGSADPVARAALDAYPDLASFARSGRLAWEGLEG